MAHRNIQQLSFADCMINTKADLNKRLDKINSIVKAVLKKSFLRKSA